MREGARKSSWRRATIRIAAMAVIFGITMSGGEVAVAAADGDCKSDYKGCVWENWCEEHQDEGCVAVGCLGVYECWNQCSDTSYHLVCVVEEVE